MEALCGAMGSICNMLFDCCPGQYSKKGDTQGCDKVIPIAVVRLKYDCQDTKDTQQSNQDNPYVILHPLLWKLVDSEEDN